MSGPPPPTPSMTGKGGVILDKAAGQSVSCGNQDGSRCRPVIGKIDIRQPRLGTVAGGLLFYRISSYIRTRCYTTRNTYTYTPGLSRPRQRQSFSQGGVGVGGGGWGEGIYRGFRYDVFIRGE